MKTKLLLTLLAFIVVATNAQVTKLNSNRSLSTAFPLGSNKTILVSGVDSTLWITDGSTGGTFQLNSSIFYKGDGAILNGKVIFKGRDAANGIELFITDGTIAGTGLVKDIYTGPTSSIPDDDMVLLNGNVYFTAVTAAAGRELWKTNGTEAGTTMVKDIVPGTEGSNIAGDYSLSSNGSYLLFSAKTPTSGIELWKSDGTDAGTILLKDINPGAPSSDANSFFKYNNIVLFQAKDAANGTEIWKTDGTTAGTVLLKNINAVGNSTSLLGNYFFYIFNGRVYFN
ncbi:MAG TPA: ELWxxDGT repeat protein, partial [Segetibacter sp.]